MRRPSHRTTRRATFEFLETRLAPAELSELQILAPTIDQGDTLHENDQLGWAVAIDGDTMVAGARLDDHVVEGGGAAYVYQRVAGNWQLQQKLVNVDAQPDDEFGTSVAIEGDTIVVGAIYADVGNTLSTGAVFVFSRVGGSWVQSQKIVASDYAQGDQFGTSVSLSGNTIVVGAPYDDSPSTDNGSVYVLARDNQGVWSQQQKLTVPTGRSDLFGQAVSISGDNLVVGSPNGSASYIFSQTNGTWSQSQILRPLKIGGADFGRSVDMRGNELTIGAPQEDGIGAAYAYVNLSGVWTLEKRTTGTGAGSSYGRSVSIDGDVWVVGEQFADFGGVSWTGAATIFERVGGNWTLQTQLHDADPARVEQFGNAVAVDAGMVVVGCYYDSNASGPSAGSVTIFEKSLGAWNPFVKLLAVSNDASQDELGQAIAVDGDTLVAGAHLDNVAGRDSGAAYIYVRFGTQWIIQQKLTTPDISPEGRLGAAVAIDGDTVVVGAPFQTVGSASSGVAYVFVRSAGAWVFQQKLVAAIPSNDQRFGQSLAIDGDTIVVGAERDAGGFGTNSGAGYVFTRTNGIWTQQQKLLPSSGAAGDFFGRSVSIGSDTIFVGATGNDVAASNAGAVFVFQKTGAIWFQTQRLTASNAGSGDNFGLAISISGDTAAISAPYRDSPGKNSVGIVYSFSRINGVWTEQQNLSLPNPVAEDSFGSSVSLSGDRLLIGAYLRDTPEASDRGTASMLTRQGGLWTFEHTLTTSHTKGRFAFSVATNGNDAFVGYPFADTSTGGRSGAVYVYAASPTLTSLSPTSGASAGGTLVTVLGTNFTGATAVTFGGIASSFTILSATEISVIAPSHVAGTVEVVVTTPAGATAIAGPANDFIYITNPSLIAFQVNGGDADFVGLQRSMIKSLAFTFDHAVTIDPAAFALSLKPFVRDGVPGVTEGDVNTGLTYSSPDGGFTWIVRFSGATVIGGSISDGRYGITLDHAKVKLAAFPAVTMAADNTQSFHRLFGDIDGDGVVSNDGDFASFKSVLGASAGSSPSIAVFDFNADGAILAIPDFSEIKKRVSTASENNSLELTSQSAAETPRPAPTVTSLSTVVGPTTGGTLVAIRGLNFVSISGVTFDGVPASTFSVVSMTEIVAIAPAHGMGAVNVVVSSLGGESSLLGASDFSFAHPAIASVIVNGGPDIILNEDLPPVSLAGQSSVVKQILVEFNQPVSVASDAFTIRPRTKNVLVNGGAAPSTAVVDTSITPLSASEYLITFSGPGTHDGIIDSGIYDLTTHADKVSAHGDTMTADRTTTFFALFGVLGETVGGANPSDSNSVGDGSAHVFVDPGSLFQFSDAFGAAPNGPAGAPRYNVAFDKNLDGFIDPGDLFALTDAFGVDWVF